MKIFVSWVPYLSCTLAGIALGLLIYERLSDRQAETLYHVCFGLGLGLYFAGLIFKEVV